MSASPLRVAVVGSGPAGFYAADALLKSEDPRVEVDMIERLPTPWGLVRLGVAPDHPKIKSVSRAFEKTALQPGFRFLGNIEVGRDVQHEELVEHYDAVVYAVGAQTDRRLGIPGEDLAGSWAATEFVAWYNGHPDFQHLEFDLTHERVVVIGNGNVAIDCARMLALTPEEKAWGKPAVIASLEVTKMPEDKRPERLKKAMENPQPILDSIQKTYDVALKNLKTLEDAGITIATGTDAGNIGTIHGPAIFREFQLMKQAGLTPMQILQCTTANAAKVFGGETGAKIGALKPGNFADLVILKSNPLDDIKNASDIDSVVKNGVIYQANTLLP